MESVDGAGPPFRSYSPRLPEAMRSQAITATLRSGTLVLAALLAACAAPVYEPPPPPRPVPVPAPAGTPADGAALPAPVPEPPPAPPPPIPPPTPPPSSGATAALIEQSLEFSAAGNYPLATSTLERALRINPRDAEVWLELGRLKLRQGDGAQAQSMGRRALALAGSDAALRARCEALIAAAGG